MRINFDNNKVNYTGVGTGPLKGIFMTSGLDGIAAQISSLTPKTGLNVYSIGANGGIVSTTKEFQTRERPALTWAQDVFSIVGNKLFIDTKITPETGRIGQIASKLVDYFGLKYEYYPSHLQGGNYILNKTKGSRDLLVGEYDKFYLSEKDFAKRFDVDNVYMIPQVAAHLDAFMFVDGKRAFVCDDNMMLSEIEKGIKNAEKELESSNYTDFQISSIYICLSKIFYNFWKVSKSSPYAPTQEAVKALEKAGYETIRIPGRLYDFKVVRDQIQHVYGTNFANAIVHKNSSGDTVLLTNESSNDFVLGLDDVMAKKINFSFKQIFLNAISPYIKRENVHFITGNNNAVFDLLGHLGGIHCCSTEII